MVGLRVRHSEKDLTIGRVIHVLSVIWIETDPSPSLDDQLRPTINLLLLHGRSFRLLGRCLCFHNLLGRCVVSQTHDGRVVLATAQVYVIEDGVVDDDVLPVRVRRSLWDRDQVALRGLVERGTLPVVQVPDQLVALV